jgi:hypothetical protein
VQVEGNTSSVIFYSYEKYELEKQVLQVLALCFSRKHKLYINIYMLLYYYGQNICKNTNDCFLLKKINKYIQNVFSILRYIQLIKTFTNRYLLEQKGTTNLGNKKHEFVNNFNTIMSYLLKYIL